MYPYIDPPEDDNEIDTAEYEGPDRSDEADDREYDDRDNVEYETWREIGD